MNFLQLLRKRKGKSQQDMADLLGMTRQTYARRESHPESMTIEEAMLVSRVLDVDVGHLSTGIARFVDEAPRE